ncbi:MAG: CvpA family protein [Synergistetes bacterium]|nr:CvpA family protein [Synergistota bacterium]MCX8127387.1 CvpA family protein [Synergistota bacterium]MDW8192251.1 CvpA family protein [Synergistota bacterium]
MSGERLSFGFLDLLSLITLLFFSVRGWFKGIARELCAMIGLVLGLVAAFKYSSALSSILGRNFPTISPLSRVIAFALIFLCILVFFSLLGGFLNKILRILWLGWFDRMGGLLLGLVEGGFIISILFWGINLLPDSTILKELKGESFIYKIFESHALPYLREMIGKLKWR